MKKGLIIGIVAAMIMTAGCSGFSNDYVGTVAGEKITKDEYSFFLKSAKSTMESTAGIQDESAKQAFWKGKEEALKKEALEQAKQFKIQLIKANEKKIKPNEEKIKTQIDQTIKQAGGKEKAEKAIKEKFGLTYDQYVDLFRKSNIIQQFSEQDKTELQSKLQISDSDIEKNYNDNKSQYYMATVKHILFTTIDTNTHQPLAADKQEEAKKKAEDTLKKAKAGQDFAALAKELSEDPGSKDKGGEYEFPKGQMMKEFEEWSFDSKRKAGDIDIIKTDYGYHVMKFEKVRQKPLSEVKDEIKTSLTESKVQEEMKKQIETWMKDPKYNIQINKKVYDSFDVKPIISQK